MQKNKIVLVIALGLILSPTLALYAEETGASVDVGAGGNIQGVYNQDKTDKTPLPPVRNPGLKPKLGDPLKKPVLGTMGDEATVQAGAEAKVGVRTQISLEELKANREKRIEAQEENRAKVQAGAEARKKEILAKLKERKDEIKKKLDAKAQERVKKTLENVFKMLSNQIDRLTKVDVRISDKIKVLESSNVDVTAMSAQYLVAQTALEKAKVDVNAANSISIDQTSTTTSKEALRALVKTAEDSIKTAGAEYRKVIDLLPESDVHAESDTKVETRTSTSTNVEQ